MPAKGEVKPPHKAYTAAIKVDAWTPEDLARKLRQIALDIDMYGARTWVSSDTGIVTIEHDAEMTEERWEADLEAYVANVRAKRAEQ